ncbi:hypothetical protein TSUD_329160 [Trifolium subterraneum]|uniref:Uncharacterized protein n=1 Tax=Trifolium subterraneum TaxID=3900 RepID=A0A2Z6M8P1_TRISU|nr:hypothetical protein TSUD_329160 [Trifolium subterraneum]
MTSKFKHCIITLDWHVLRGTSKGEDPDLTTLATVTREVEEESVIGTDEEEAEEEGPLASSLTDKINRMRRIAEDLLASGELPEGSRARRDVQEIWDVGNYARQYQRRGGRHAT